MRSAYDAAGIYEVERPRWPNFNEPSLDRVFAPQELDDQTDSSNTSAAAALPSFAYDRRDFFLGFWGDDALGPPRDFDATNSQERPLLGVCSGHTLGGQVYIELLWVKKSDRRKGLGARLLRQAELLGVRRCQARGAYLNTFSFQGAEPFYASQGYARLMVIPGCFDGTVERVYMGKMPLS